MLQKIKSNNIMNTIDMLELMQVKENLLKKSISNIYEFKV